MKKLTTFFFPIVLLLISAFPVQGDTIRLPGIFKEFVHYITYNYPVEGDELLFHLNELLLFEVLPTWESVENHIIRGPRTPYKIRKARVKVMSQLKRLTRLTYTHRLREIFKMDQVVKDYVTGLTGIQGKPGNTGAKLSFDLNTREGQLGAAELMIRIGLKLTMDGTGRFKVLEYHTPTFRVNHYFKLHGLSDWRLTNAINKSRRFTFSRRTCNLEIPFSLDFLSSATGTVLTSVNLAHQLVFDRRLQLFLGLLFRLSNREIEFIGGLAPDNGAWKSIYNNDRLLNGMFLLSHSLRVKDGGLLLPGGDRAVNFWQQLTGLHPLDNPRGFLETLALKDDGKLNYFYVMGFFLDPEVQKKVFRDYDAAAFNEIYRLVRLKKNELLDKKLKRPGLNHGGLFSLFYVLEARDGKIFFPGGARHWATALGADRGSFRDIIKQLLRNKKTQAANIRRFTAIYAKFIDRPELLSPQVLKMLFQRYDQYNVLVDFIEQLPLRKPDSVIRLFDWAASFSGLKGGPLLKKKDFYTWRSWLLDSQGKRSRAVAIFQSLLAILAHGAGNNSGQYDYDRLIEALTQIPLFPEDKMVKGVFDFLHYRCGLDLTPLEADGSMVNFVLNGVAGPEINPEINPEITLGYQSYVLDARGHMEQVIKEILEKQKVRAFSDIIRLNAAATSKKEESSAEMLKHFLVTNVYALHSLSSDLRIYLNPGFTRLHDFSNRNKKTPWNTSSLSFTDLKLKFYHMEGGLSRIPVILSAPVSEQLFRLKLGEYTRQTAPMIYNNLDLYPVSPVGRSMESVGKLVQLGMDLLKKAESETQAAVLLKDRFALITSGYHYRKIMAKLEGKRPRYYPYFRELLRLGEQVFMELYERNPAAYYETRRSMHALGPVYANSFNRLRPYRFFIFPQALSQLFKGGIIGGEMNNELKIKMAYTAYKRKTPPQLLGFLASRYLEFAALYFSQKYENDFYKTYFVYDVFNHLYLDRLIKTLKQTGVLRIK